MRSALGVAILFAMGFNTSSRADNLPWFHLYHDVRAYVTGYNTLPGQTDDTPCTAASGADICGRTDAVACPRYISLGTHVEIHGSSYVCEDRLAKKYDSRFDISCDKDLSCPPIVTGWTVIRVFAGDWQRPVAAPLSRTLVRAASAVLRGRFGRAVLRGRIARAISRAAPSGGDFAAAPAIRHRGDAFSG